MNCCRNTDARAAQSQRRSMLKETIPANGASNAAGARDIRERLRKRRHPGREGEAGGLVAPAKAEDGTVLVHNTAAVGIDTDADHRLMVNCLQLWLRRGAVHVSQATETRRKLEERISTQQHNSTTACA